MPTVRESAISLCRLGLPDVVPVADALTTFETKPVGIPAAAQFLARVAGAVPWPMKFTSQGSLAKENSVAEGRNSSVMAGARIDLVRLPRNRMSWTGDQRMPSVQVGADPAME